MDSLRQLWEQQRWRVILAALGVVMAGVGVWQMGVQSLGNEVEVIEATSDPSASSGQGKPQATSIQEVVVDVGGAVVKPGLYRLSSGIRMGEVLTEAGGMTEEADTEWVGKMMNLAEVVKDGMKVYVPFKGDAGTNNQSSIINNQTNAVAGLSVVNVNAASVGELDALWGIGAARAKQIIENRPYGSIEELGDKAGIPQNVLEANQGKWGVY